jgi:hypothetical protein
MERSLGLVAKTVARSPISAKFQAENLIEHFLSRMQQRMIFN